MVLFCAFGTYTIETMKAGNIMSWPGLKRTNGTVPSPEKPDVIRGRRKAQEEKEEQERLARRGRWMPRAFKKK